MGAETENYNLSLLKKGQSGWDTALNDNFDTIADILHDVREDQITNSGVTTLTPFPYPIGYNRGFDHWQRGTLSSTSGFTADMWYMNIVAGPAVTAERISGASFDNVYAMKVTVDDIHDEVDIYNDVPYKSTYSDFYKEVRGKIVTASFDILTSVAFAAHLSIVVYINDGTVGGETTQAFTEGSHSTVEKVKVTHYVDPASIRVRVGVRIEATSGTAKTVSIGNMMCSVGDFSSPTDFPYIPIHPQDDVCGCMAVYQKNLISIRWWGIEASHGTFGYSYMYPCVMLDTPTAVITDGTVIGGTLSSLSFTPKSHLFGNIVAVGVQTAPTATASISATDNILELNVTGY